MHIISKIMTYVSPTRSSPKEKFAHYIRRTYNRSLIPIVSSSETSLCNRGKRTYRKYNIHKHTSPFIPQVVPTYLTLHGQCYIHHKNVFMSYGSRHKTFPGLYSPWVHGRDSSHDGRQPLPHDRFFLKQTSPRGNGSRIHITRREDTYVLTLS
jgi:hypothetical protein